MAWQLSAVVVLFVSLAVILYYGSHVRANVFPEITDYSQPTTAATIQTRAQPSLSQPTNQVPHKTLATRSMDGQVTSQTAATTVNPETPVTHTTIKTAAATSLVTTNSTLSTSPITNTLLTTLATPDNTHTTTPVTEATIGPSAGPGSPPTTITTTSSAYTTGTRSSTVSHTTGKTTQLSNQTTLPATLSTSPHNSTTSQNPAHSTHTPGPTTGTCNTTQTASPTTTAPGPTLAPQPSSAKTGMYQILNGSKLCIKAEMGIQLTVQDTKSASPPQGYFNIDPNTTQVSGICGSRKSNLLLNFWGGFVNLTFTKDENSYYISEVGAYLTVSNPEKTYQGMKSPVVMFETVIGHSFKCVSEQSLELSTQLHLKTTNVQLQAFDFEDDNFGNADECFSDRNRREIPVAVGLSITGLLVVLLTACLVARKQPSRGYERM
ncbi:lysosome-associated membrane glycoprotein 3 isoform X1 [Equus przewalskii]|uniref:Lysosome-associated membrane glycoprotein 3 isoform X1 n=1 Tax=Equus przewalskii TaxID=9798 RepID=A0ABM2F8Q0_EQUPR|nr:lysosome-associated membrane glycoprotein 3 isoform X1 [Equus caballus]